MRWIFPFHCDEFSLQRFFSLRWIHCLLASILRTISFQLEIIQLSAAVNFNFILDAATVLNQVKNYSLGGLFSGKMNLKMLQHEILKNQINKKRLCAFFGERPCASWDKSVGLSFVCLYRKVNIWSHITLTILHVFKGQNVFLSVKSFCKAKCMYYVIYCNTDKKWKIAFRFHNDTFCLVNKIIKAHIIVFVGTIILYMMLYH